MTLTPAYGRDYKSKKEIQNDWDAGKDFVISDMFSGEDGRYINREDAVRAGIRSVNVRYKRLTQIAVIRVK